MTLRVIRGAINLPNADTPTAVTIGNFDGVHLGHQQMLKQVCDAAAEELVPTVMTFEPSPQEFFRGEAAPARLTSAREKLELLRDHGARQIFLARFNEALASLSAREFVRELLVRHLRPAVVVVGHDFRFGKGREGDFDLLVEEGRRHSFKVAEVAPLRESGQRVSSTLVREAIAGNHFQRAAELLGRPYAMCGRVVAGEQLGRTLGFPTANLRPRRQVLPAEGVFAVRVSGGGLSGQPGVASIGTRPTVGGRGHLLEVFVFDFNGDLYGRRLSVELVARLRGEERFDSVALMTEQMHRDAAAARTILAA